MLEQGSLPQESAFHCLASELEGIRMEVEYTQIILLGLYICGCAVNVSKHGR